MTMCRSVVLSNRCTSVVIAAAVPGSRLYVPGSKYDSQQIRCSLARVLRCCTPTCCNEIIARLGLPRAGKLQLYLPVGETGATHSSYSYHAYDTAVNARNCKQQARPRDSLCRHLVTLLQGKEQFNGTLTQCMSIPPRTYTCTHMHSSNNCRTGQQHVAVLAKFSHTFWISFNCLLLLRCCCLLCVGMM